MSSLDAIIVAIGTELTQGQIINSNAAWIASQLEPVGLARQLHLTVPDDRALILAALHSATQQSRCVILSGGLGPTRDDFTRDVIAEYLGLSLQFHAPSWERIEARAQRLGFVLGESQKQQCWFPEGAKIIPNPNGTADAFVCQQGDVRLFVLPGPPSEIKAIWQEPLWQGQLIPLLPVLPARQLRRWQCLGMPEGQVGERVEAALAGEQDLETGYRAHFPYIEVKVWSPREANVDAELAWISRLEAALSEAIVLRGDEDAAQLFWSHLPEVSLHIDDLASQGYLTQRLQPFLAQSSQEIQICQRWQADSLQAERGLAYLGEVHEGLHLVLGGLSEHGEWGIGMRWQGQRHFEQLKVPYQSRSRDWLVRWMVENAFLLWRKWL